MSDDSTYTRPTAPDDGDKTEIDTSPAAQTGGRFVPVRIGKYRIISLLGEGGMGSVYVAEQENPSRRVALKVIKPGLASYDLLRRFEQEARALGRLQHPGIAQIYEAGTADSGFGEQPFFAMEFIAGHNLLDYAGEMELDVRQRLELMARVCEAVHHAHQRGIIHRDLKPGNIIVDQTGQPKILDFGVARVADADAQATRQTDLGQLVGTLAYMSPEQVLADPLEIDTRSDVYALGVIAYRLLAGRMPYRIDGKPLHETLQIIRLEEPAALRSVNRAFRGDIETIVAKALEKDKLRRYASAAGMAGDIRRYLNNEPIIARPATAVYQLRKFALRNKAVAFAAASILVVLIAGIFFSTRAALRATRAEQSALAQRDRALRAESSANLERDRASGAEVQARRERDNSVLAQRRADSEAATAIAINDFLRSDLLAQASAANQATASTTADPDIKVRAVLDRAAGRIKGKFGDKPLVEAAIRSTIGDAYSDLGLYPQALPHLQQALELRRRAAGPDKPETLASARQLGILYERQDKLVEAETLLASTLATAQRTLGPDAPLTLLCMTSLAGVYGDRGKYGQAEPLLSQVLNLRIHKLGRSHLDTLASMQALSLLYWSQKRFGPAESLLTEALRGVEKQLGPDHPSTMDAVNNLGTLFWESGKLDQAEPLFAKTLASRRRILGPDHPDTLTALSNLGALEYKAGKYAEANANWSGALETSRRVNGPDHTQTLILTSNLAEVNRVQRHYGAAEELCKVAIGGFRRSVGAENPRSLVAMKNLALVYQDQQRYGEAAPLLTQVVEVRLRTTGRKHVDTAVALGWLGLLRLQQRDYTAAESVLRDCLGVWTQAGPDDYRRFLAESMLGASLAGLSRFAEAEPLLLSGYEGVKQREGIAPASAKPQIGEAGARIIQAYEAWPKPALAAEWRARLSAAGPAH
ncbi:MAG TPA: serine/threonine-protein kinase [Paludibaculum sp.]|jgi:tetratricopeptide (TPR) repeat protein/predicted Ser/Thr protein kinase